MKTIGILGGLGPDSTLDYYKTITRAFSGGENDFSFPEIIIVSANLQEALQIVETKDWPKLTGWLLDKVERLHKAGAEFGAIACNTPHIVFDELAERSPIPLISIVEETAKYAQQKRLKNLGLMGTKLTMGSDFYQQVFAQHGISVVVPTEKEQERIQHLIFTEIELGIFKESTHNELLSITKRMKDEDKIDGLILGCTELPLILTDEVFNIPFLNTSAIHCRSIIEYCKG